MEERRRASRRDEDQRIDNIEDEVRALRFIVTGHRDAPMTGLVSQYANLEGKVTWMIRTNIATVIAIAGAAVGRLLG
jgi:hypothetical protein